MIPSIQLAGLGRSRPPLPTGHIYWRVNFTGAANTGGYVSISELVMRAVSGGAQLCSPTGLWSASSNYSWNAGVLFDGDTSTWWANGTSPLPAWVRYQFSNPINIVEMAITATDAAYGVLGESPKAFQLQYSDNGSSWTTARSLTNQSWSYAETKTYSIP